jgi:hypothetical protein
MAASASKRARSESIAYGRKRLEKRMPHLEITL